ncbi:SLBB domain-containing protein [Pantanalinema rosaneae CENA516]|uniref:SLBB domain-containing protein n=1 Tax=Pantanalinema rosaneae TaxID=1620701 RepID=UPI003D6FA1D5
MQQQGLKTGRRNCDRVALAAFIGLLASTTPVMAITQPTNQSIVAPPSPSQLPNDDGYLLGAGDRVRIDFFNVPEFSGEYQVLPNGTLNLPQVGAVSVQGKTLQQASTLISTRYASILKRPIVTIGLLTARPIVVAIAGEISRPGSYTITPPTIGDNRVTTTSNVIQLAGGITQAADIRRIQVRRTQPDTAGMQVITLDLWQLIQTGNLNQDLRLQDGDSIFIPTATTIDLNAAQTLAAANFAATPNRPLKIAVVGEVYRPGPYVITPGVISGAAGQTVATANQTPQFPSVTRAIQLAGGITESADIRNIQVRRLTRSGVPQKINLDFWQLLKAGDNLQDLPLQDGDTIEIPTAKSISPSEATELAAASFSPDRIIVNVVGEVAQPGAIQVRPNIPLNQALLAAGGFTNNAKKSSVTLIRVNPNGSVTKREIKVDFAQGLNDTRNPIMRNNDIILVRRSTFAGIVDTVGRIIAPVSGSVGVFGGVLNLIRTLNLND